MGRISGAELVTCGRVGKDWVGDVFYVRGFDHTVSVEWWYPVGASWLVNDEYA